LSKRKNQNSVLVLATLGVYLGLVLVGATPQVLAQAAMTKQFNVKDEVEVKENLDKNPNGQSAEDAFENYLFHAEEFFERLGELGSSNRSAENFGTIEMARTVLIPCIAGDRTGIGLNDGKIVASNAVWKPLHQLADRLSDGYNLGDCIRMDFKGKPSNLTNTHFRIHGGDAGLAIELHIQKSSAGNAQALVEELQTALREYDSSAASQIRIQLLKYSGFRADNGHVMIYTVLPRSALDTLLATDAK
jgi:hypothetical protein